MLSRMRKHKHVTCWEIISLWSHFIYIDVQHPCTTEHMFPIGRVDDTKERKADIALIRRKEVSKIGRFLRNNGISNNGAALTLLLK